MSNPTSIFGDMTVADILTRINHITNMSGYITSAFEALSSMEDGDSGSPGAPGNVLGEAKANAIATVVQSREATNQQILRLYEKMYDDMIRLHTTVPQPAAPAEPAAE